MASFIEAAGLWCKTLPNSTSTCVACNRTARLKLAVQQSGPYGESYCSLRCWGAHMDRSANIVGNEAGARLFTGTLIPWARIVASHALLGQQGLSHYNDRNGIEVLMYRSRGGYLEGVLRRSTSGELSVYVDPRRQHRGIGTILVREAARRWGVDLSVQRFTPSGLALAQKALPVDRNIGDPAWMKNPS